MVPLGKGVLRCPWRARVIRLATILPRRTYAAIENPQVKKRQNGLGERLPERNQSKNAINGKLRDISNQISKTVTSNNSSSSESLEILEEGLSYLRDVQHAEGISEESLYSVFQPILVHVFTKITKSKDIDIEQALDMLVTYGVAHSYHFSQAMVQALANSQDSDEKYKKVLSLWVRYLEYSKISQSNNLRRVYRVLREKAFHSNDILNLSYYAYVQSCILHGIKYDFKDALKLFQVEELPELFQIRRTISSLGLTHILKNDFAEFEKQLEKINLESLDPNGKYIYGKISQAINHRDKNLLDKIFEQMKEACEKNRTPINEGTLIKLMDGYYECDQHTSVFFIFQQMLRNGIHKPSINAWDFVIRSMGHPSHIRSLNGEQRKTVCENIERTIDTIVSNGTELTPKTLSIIVGCFANLNRFDKVEKYLQTYSVQGEGKIPLIHTTKNNILIGYLLNGKVKEAEVKLKEFMSEGSSYVPSTTTMNSFLSFYSKQRNYKAIDGILKFMKLHHIPAEVGTYTIMVDLYFKMNREKGLEPDLGELIHNLTTEGAGSKQINEHTISAIIDGLVKDGSNLEAARTLFELISKKNKRMAETLTSMIKGEVDYGLVGNAERLFDHYIKNVSNDVRIWNLMIRALLNEHEELALEYYFRQKEAAKLNISAKPNYFTYYFLLSHFVKKNRQERIQFFIDELADKKRHELGLELPRMLRSLSRRYSVSPALLKEINT